MWYAIILLAALVMILMGIYIGLWLEQRKLYDRIEWCAGHAHTHDNKEGQTYHQSYRQAYDSFGASSVSSASTSGAFTHTREE